MLYNCPYMACPDNLGDCLTLKTGTVGSTYPGVNSLLNNVVPNIFVAAGIIIFFMILLGGYKIIIGGSDTHSMDEGKKVITSAIMGLGVMFASYWIIQIIQVLTGIPILKSTL